MIVPEYSIQIRGISGTDLMTWWSAVPFKLIVIEIASDSIHFASFAMPCLASTQTWTVGVLNQGRKQSHNTLLKGCASYSIFYSRAFLSYLFPNNLVYVFFFMYFNSYVSEYLLLLFKWSVYTFVSACRFSKIPGDYKVL